MRKHKGELYRILVTPKNGWSIFPIDMLRYDVAWPASEADSGRIIQSLHGGEFASIELLSQREPTAARWESFGWLVTEVR